MIGTDEAGYGPKLGPLVVASTLWLGKPDSPQPLDLATAVDLLGERLPLVDSKRLYQPGHASAALSELEAVALALVSSATNQVPESAQQLLLTVSRTPVQANSQSANPFPGTNEFNSLKLPVTASPQRIEEIAACLRELDATSGIRIASLQLHCVLPAQFNSLVQQRGNKAPS